MSNADINYMQELADKLTTAEKEIKELKEKLGEINQFIQNGLDSTYVSQMRAWFEDAKELTAPYAEKGE